jgi:hypothetical protein
MVNSDANIQELSPEASLAPCPTKIDIETIAEDAESACEFDPYGGPPVVIVNWQGAAVITSAFEREVFWEGVALRRDSADNLVFCLLRPAWRSENARANLNELITNIARAQMQREWGGDLAIVNTTTDGIEDASTNETKRTKCEERGHLIQHYLQRAASASGFRWYEDLYDRPEAQRFVESMKRWTLYDAENKISMVNEFAMKINNGTWREYDVQTDAAKAWITQYFCEVRQNLGRETLLKFRSILIGRIAKAAFRASAFDCGNAGVAA